MISRDFIALIAFICFSRIKSAPAVCETDTTVIGYDTIKTLNDDMLAEETRIRNGATPNEPYIFILCPQTVFVTATDTLMPLLNNAILRCGPNGDSGSCLFFGGSQQILITDSTVPGYSITNLSFEGITFTQFDGNAGSGVSVDIRSTGPTEVDLINPIWTNFDQANFLVRQASPEARVVVNIRNAEITKGSAGVVFDNNGGTFNIDSLTIDELSAAAVLATANGGNSFLVNTIVKGSDVDSITFTTTGGSQTISNIEVSDMIGIGEAFYVEDAASSLRIFDSNIIRNVPDNTGWRFVSARGGASAEITNTIFDNNSGVQFGIVAQNPGSSVTLIDSKFNNNVGRSASNTTSAVLFAFQNGVITMLQTDHNDNADFTGEALAFTSSSFNAERSCIQGGSNMQFVVFIDRTSTFSERGNFIGSQDSDRCISGPRLFKERNSDACFLGGQCLGFCEVWATQTECRPPTLAPTVSPTEGPSSAFPTMAPSNTEPTISPSPSMSPTTELPTEEPQIPLCPDGSDPIKVFPRSSKSAKRRSKSAKSKSSKSSRRVLRDGLLRNIQISDEYLRYGGVSRGRNSDQYPQDGGDYILVCPPVSSKSSKSGGKKAGGKKTGSSSKSAKGSKSSKGSKVASKGTKSASKGTKAASKGSKSRRLETIGKLRGLDFRSTTSLHR